jgi:hypothetical protein
MPGHGRTVADSHKELPTVDADAAALERDLAPFRALAGRARIGMTGHILFPAWDAQNPATQSPRIVGEIIRTSIGFDGLLMTDDLDMEALSGSIASARRAALRRAATSCSTAGQRWTTCWALRRPARRSLPAGPKGWPPRWPTPPCRARPIPRAMPNWWRGAMRCWRWCRPDGDGPAQPALPLEAQGEGEHLFAPARPC